MKFKAIAVFVLILGLTLALTPLPVRSAEADGNRIEAMRRPPLASPTDADGGKVEPSGPAGRGGEAVALDAPTEVWVDDDYTSGSCGGHTWGVDCFNLIQDGIDAVAAGGKVNVAAGTYGQCLNIDTRSGLIIEGADKATTTIKPNCTLGWNVGGYGTSRQVAVRVVSATGIEFSNFTFDFDLVKANTMYGMLWWDSAGGVRDSVLKNLSMPDAGGGYSEIGAYVKAPSYTDVARASVAFYRDTFIDMGRVGILTHSYVDVDIRYNTFYKTTDDFGYAMELASQSIATVIENTIYGYDTPAASDGSSSAGIYVENCFTSGSPHVNKTVTLQQNEIYGCQYALHIGNEFDGYAGDVDIQFSSVGNNYHDNVGGGVVLADEDRSAGSSVNAGFQNDTFTNNGDFGAFIYSWGDGDILARFTGVTISGHEEGIVLADYATGLSGSNYDIGALYSNLAGNSSYAVDNAYAGAGLWADMNWWGDPSGPSGIGGGTGGRVAGNVDYSPWLARVPGTSPMTYGADTTSGTPHLNGWIDTMFAGDSLVLRPGNYAGGFSLDKDGIIFKGERGTVIGPGSHGVTVSADDITIDGLTFDGTGGSGGDCGIYVTDGVERLWVRSCEIRNWPGDGIYTAGTVTGLKIVDNYVHNNTGDGVDFAATPGGLVYIYGNAFRSNTGVGMTNAGGTAVDATYNEWGDVAGPTGTNGDGVGTNVTYNPWVFTKHWVDAPPAVREMDSMNIYARMDVHHLYGTSFTLTFPKDKLQLTAEPVIGGFKTASSYGSLTTMAAANASGEIQLVHNRMDPDAEYDATNDILLTLQFQAQEITGLSDTAIIGYKDDTASAGAKGGVHIFLDSATGDTITILGTTTVNGVVDLQGRDNDSGAVVDPLAGGAYGYDPAPVTTGSWGTYSFSNMTDDSYTFTIEMARYLDASAVVVVGGDTKTLNKVVLLGGDATDDDHIDISDAGIIGGQFGRSGGGITDTRADINNDNLVDILDLVLMGGNYEKTSSPWTP